MPRGFFSLICVIIVPSLDLLVFNQMGVRAGPGSESWQGMLADWIGLYDAQRPVWWFEMVRGREAFSDLAFAKEDPFYQQERSPASVPVIAILDSGLDESHPSLAGKVWETHAPEQLVVPLIARAAIQPVPVCVLALVRPDPLL